MITALRPWGLPPPQLTSFDASFSRHLEAAAAERYRQLRIRGVPPSVALHWTLDLGRTMPEAFDTLANLPVAVAVGVLIDQYLPTLRQGMAVARG